MGRFTYLLRDLEQILFPNREQHAIPAMDGGLAPNDRLEALSAVGDPIPGADDFAEGRDGAIYVSAGKQVLRLAGKGYENRSVFAEFQGTAGGLVFHPDGRLLVCVADHGLAMVDASGSQQWLKQADGQPLRHLTSVAATVDGAIFACEASSRNGPDDWVRDLMAKNHLGRLISCGPGLDTAQVLLRNMHYPSGVSVAADGKSLWFVESWIHRVSRASIDGFEISAPQTVIGNLPGYPARIGSALGGGFWLSIFAARTHLVEFVLLEDEFREEMMQTIPQTFWVAPSLMATNHVLEPMQMGGIKSLGIEKPWAPPRSYGLIARIDGNGEIQDSLHSRVGGRYHGVTAAKQTLQGLVVISKGAGRVLLDVSGGEG